MAAITANAGVLQRKCACGRDVGPTGECAECRRKHPGGQSKLTINRPGDRYEQEADRIADAVLGPGQAFPALAAPTSLQRSSMSALEEEEEEMQAKEMPGQTPAVSAGAASQINSLRGGGAPLTDSPRRFFESRLGHDFSQVRIHADRRAAQAASAVNARAFTLGRDVFFGQNQYAPQTADGQRLLAHELVHVAQQSGNRASPATIQREPEDESGDPSAPAPAAPAPAATTPVCDPNRKLTWADFTGSPPSSTFAATTKWTFPKIASSKPVQYQAKFDGGASWVKKKWGKPADRSATRCDKTVKPCVDWLKKNPGGNWTTTKGTPSASCPASPVMNATKSTTEGECNTILGKECDRVALVESNRLLAHEQLHFDIACVLVKKANASIAGGKSASTVKSGLDTKSASVTSSYDTETNHGCKAAKQAAWATKVGNGLPKVTVP